MNVLTLVTQVPEKRKLMGQDSAFSRSHHMANVQATQQPGTFPSSVTEAEVTFGAQNMATLSPSAKVISRLMKFLFFFKMCNPLSIWKPKSSNFREFTFKCAVFNILVLLKAY